ncbi:MULTISPECIES: septal ring lytic transglycosylase RlpA family protein [unclassified Oceanispirochaeta]|uniref:septal ring lytic transglycosylase RlpA family protein n=1 Tax=unclassified Oceanispirochaeta TaxID=2635722 RepID=UPI001314AC9B|nr:MULTISPECIES: septal ring lytic transglycosylase RlpA family protein [unclassified Oceanispirochaeta]MBF9017844.1 septal ring lytic transglycosylase RlpA family protein [Oceanispirochaeta sp. M2]NPD74304.1 septal ring lytic transglycosylase RlpA family protein [Oceanispirochaeta sp. M1]
MKKMIILSLLVIILPVFGLYAYEEEGIASWYGGKFHGRLTANGETFNTHELTAAHKQLPFNTMVTVTNKTNGKSVQVRINDRGPFVDGRTIDLSYAAAVQLEMIKTGTAPIILQVDSMDFLEIRFSIQVGAYGNLENATAMKRKLEANGFSPKATLNNKGVTRIYLADIPEDETMIYADRLKTMGITNILIKQN